MGFEAVDGHAFSKRIFTMFTLLAILFFFYPPSRNGLAPVSKTNLALTIEREKKKVNGLAMVMQSLGITNKLFFEMSPPTPPQPLIHHTYLDKIYCLVIFTENQ